ncbi:Cutinase transcription factor 1 beta [Cladobotryum mycophilum]|uniref:Cutinase transcription factor 1 beta n=1 Tax=Cladobotryum mycophilum TaxID=491253 RepID=A0ABR0SME0_9HYPO
MASESTILAMADDFLTANSSPSPSPSEELSSHSAIRAADGKAADDKNKKRPATDTPDGPPKVTKRRAARACVSCRARKVRCDVVEGAPCGNCRWDNVENLITATTVGQGSSTEAQLRCKAPPANPIAINSADLRRTSSGSAISSTASIEISNNGHGHGHGNGSGNGNGNGNGLGSSGVEGHVPHMLYQRSGFRNEPALFSKAQSVDAAAAANNNNYNSSSSNNNNHSSPWASTPSVNHSGFGDARSTPLLSSIDESLAFIQLPPFVRPLPSKIASDDVRYLYAKGALSIPCATLQNAFLRAYIEYVHPYMPLIDLHPFLSVINRYDGMEGQISLFLYHAVMFSATAFVDMRHLREAGYSTRKAARKAYFQKTRLLYDFDYESDRLVLVQGLMLMTYWYETPDDQKDTWHWMGVAISLAHTIGLHRNPEVTSMAPATQKLWKRIWWSCFMRDRLIALGMRRPTRIKDEDFDVPMLVESDFEIQALPDHITIVPSDCTLMRDVEMQRELAVMCIEKAKLCICVSNMLKTQYSVLIRDNVKPENTTNSTMMLFPNKKLDNVDNVRTVDAELRAWVDALPACCEYRMLVPGDIKNGKSTIAVQRTLLHMVYHTTVSALHRPQFLPSSPSQMPTPSRQVQEMSRHRVKDAAMHITGMATELHHLRLERYLPTTGVTVILPAMIIHLLEMKNPMPDARSKATRGFRQCMRVMEKLREIYAAADYATGFLDAALRKAAIDINANIEPSTLAMMKEVPQEFSAQTPPPDNAPYMTASESLFHQKPKEFRQPIGQPPTINTAVLELSAANSPPHTDFDSADLTPSATNESEGHPLEMDVLNMDFVQDPDEFDWNAVSGTDLDVDQWLQFPPEGLNGVEEDMMVNRFNSDAEATKAAEDALGWILNTDGDAAIHIES